MKTADFDYDLPRHFIATRPSVPRDSARLLEVGRNLTDRIVRDLPARLRAGDVLVVNDTRVVPARLFGRRGAATIELTLHRRIAADTWRAFARPAKRLRPGDRIEIAAAFAAEVIAKHEDGELTLRLLANDDPMAALRRHGHAPLPPYIRRELAPDARDAADYQTVYAAREGAVAAPTAGLHFSHELLAAIAAQGVTLAMVTLHVGAGTFLPVKAEDPRHHKMHAEFGEVTRAAADAINAARARGGRVVAVGTTVLRLLETTANDAGVIMPFSGETDLFILPGYQFRVVDLLLTNFHLPRSTLLMLVAAFAGLARIKSAYEHAKASGYRFYSYGDCTLLHREDRL